MFVYILLLVLTISGYIFLGKANPKVQSAYYGIICIIILYVVGFRADNMGGDTYSYRQIFLHPESKSYISFSEPGLLVLNKIIRIFTEDVKIVSVIKALLCLVPVFLFIRRYSTNLFASLFLFLTFSWEGSTFLLEMSAERQCFAMAMFCIFLYFYQKNSYKFSFFNIVCLLLMVLFHYSAAVVVLLLILDRIHIKRYVFFIACIIASLSLYYIGEYLAPAIQLAEAMDKGFYLSGLEQEEQYSILSLLPFVGSFLISLFFLPDEKTNNLWFKGYFLATVLTAFMMPIGMNISRMCAYFYFCAFISLPWTFVYMKNKFIRYGFMVVLFGYFTYRFMHVLEIMSEVDGGMVPYHTFF